jgi:hypothetical protein
MVLEGLKKVAEENKKGTISPGNALLFLLFPNKCMYLMRSESPANNKFFYLSVKLVS